MLGLKLAHAHVDETPHPALLLGRHDDETLAPGVGVAMVCTHLGLESIHARCKLALQVELFSFYVARVSLIFRKRTNF